MFIGINLIFFLIEMIAIKLKSEFVTKKCTKCTKRIARSYTYSLFVDRPNFFGLTLSIGCDRSNDIHICTFVFGQHKEKSRTRK